LYGYFDKEAKKQVKGFISNLNKYNFTLVMDKLYAGKPIVTDKAIRVFYKPNVCKNVVRNCRSYL